MDQDSIFQIVREKMKAFGVTIIIVIGYVKKKRPISGIVIWILPPGRLAGVILLMISTPLHRLFLKNQKPVFMKQKDNKKTNNEVCF